MEEITRVAVDAMGGDNAPVEIVKGAVEAVNENQNIIVYLTGKEDVVRAELGKYTLYVYLFFLLDTLIIVSSHFLLSLRSLFHRHLLYPFLYSNHSRSLINFI